MRLILYVLSIHSFSLKHLLPLCAKCEFLESENPLDAPKGRLKFIASSFYDNFFQSPAANICYLALLILGALSDFGKNEINRLPIAVFKVSSIEVSVNPAKVEASSDGKYLYVSSFGNYADVPSKLQVVELASGAVKDLDYSSVSAIAKGRNDVLYILCGGYDENWNPLPGTIYCHDMARNIPLGAFVTDGTVLPKAYSISAASDGYIYVGCSDYVTTGDVYVLTPEGRLHDKFDSQGLNPIRAY